MAKKTVKIGDTVTYVPGEQDYAARPRNTEMPAVITAINEKEFKDEKGKSKTVSVYNLNVHQDTDSGIARRLKVKHEGDAAEGESYFK